MNWDHNLSHEVAGMVYTDLLNVPNYTQPWFQVKKLFTPKRVSISSKLNLWQIAVTSKVYNNIHTFSNIPYKYLANTQLKVKKYFAFHFLDILHKNRVKILP